MKKKVMQAIFVLLFLLGVFVGFLIPGDMWLYSKKTSIIALQPAIYDVSKRMGQLSLETDYYKAGTLAETLTGNVGLMRVDDKLPLNYAKSGNVFVYIYKGKAAVSVSDAYEEVGPGKLLAIPKGVHSSIKRIGDSPVEMIVFSTPPSGQPDMVFVK